MRLFILQTLLLITYWCSAQTTVQIGNGTVNESGKEWNPIYRSGPTSGFRYSRAVYLYTESELFAAGIYPGATISAIQFRKTSNGSIAASNTATWSIRIKSTTQIPGSSWANTNFNTEMNGATVCINQSPAVVPSTTPVWINLPFTTNFVYNGGNIVIGSLWDLPSGNTQNSAFSWEGTNVSNQVFGGAATTTNPPMTLQTVRPNIQLTYTGGSLPTCFPVSNLTVGSITGTGATITFTAPTTGTPTQYEYAVTTSATPPTSGTLTGNNSTSITVTGLSQLTSYYAHVRTRCGASDVSSWRTSAQFTADNYCASTSSTQASYISNFVTTGGLTNISNASTFSSNGFSGYPSVSASQLAGGSVSFTASITGLASGTAIWIDYNNDGVFDDNLATEKVYSSNGFPASANGIFTIPAATSAGSKRMRVRTDQNSANPTPCGNISSGETEDYTFVVAALVCNEPTGVTLTTASTTSATLSWSAPAGTPTEYEYAVTTSATPPTSGTLTGSTGTSASISGLTPLTVYYGHVRTRCGTSATSMWVTSQPILLYNYCVTSPSTGSPNDIITNVTLGTLNQTSTSSTAFPAYFTAYANTPVDVIRGSNQNISITFGAEGTQHSAVWIDLNQNNIFDASEALALSVTPAGSNATVSYTLAVPGTATTGLTRMRVRGGANVAYTAADACTQSVLGETEDYVVNIIDPPACNAPGGLSATNVTSTSANLSWLIPSPAPANGYEYVINNSASTPTGSGTPITATSLAATGLGAGRTYYLHVRSVCGITNVSPWASISFFTPISNDNQSNPTPLIVGAACPSIFYSNQGATLSAGEPFPSCSGTAATPVWFSFVAPASGAVRVSTDHPGGTLDDTRIAIFDGNTIIACDEDGGATPQTDFLSTTFAVGLTPGQTYTIAVDRFNSSSAFGTFCVTVDELDQSMLPSSGTCTPIPAGFTSGTPSYTGWWSMLSADGKLFALVKRPAGVDPDVFTGNLFIHTGATRVSGNAIPYLDRNVLINAPTSNVIVVLPFTSTELSGLTSQGATLAGLGVTKVEGTVCSPNAVPVPSATSFIPQTSSGSTSNVAWIEFFTTSFSNFYIHQGTAALPIQLKSFSAKANGNTNLIKWVTATERNTLRFVVERSSDGITNWEAIGAVSAQGYSSQEKSYTLEDRTPLMQSYYRLLSIDQDGSEDRWQVVHVNRRSGAFNVTSIYPSPTPDVLHVQFDAESESEVLAQVFDMAGSLAYTQRIDARTGLNAAVLHISDLAAGVYTLTLTSEQAVSMPVRILKQ